MKLSTLAVALSIASIMPTASFAATTPFSDTATANKAQGVPPGDRISDTFSILTAGLYAFGLTVGPNSNNSPSGSMTASLYKLSGALSSLVSSITLPVTNGSTSSDTKEISLGLGNYVIRWQGEVTGGPRANGTLTGTASVTAVPGPEAGAGLGAVAMLGAAYWAKRRRNEKVLLP